MALKLLSPTEAQDKSRKSVESLAHRVAEVESLLLKRNQELDTLEAKFDDVLQKQRSTWSAEQQEHNNHIAELSKMVEKLEERKRQALIPLTKRAEELNTIANSLNAREEKLSLKASELASEKELLESRLDEVAERELQAAKTAKVLQIREKGIEEQAAQVASSSMHLTAAIERAAQDATVRDNALKLREAAAVSREVTLTERERRVADKELGFDNREKALQDQRYTLEQAVKEAKQKHGIE